MNTRLISSSSWLVLFLGTCLAGSSLFGAENRYIAFFSAEQEHYRRIIIDGVGQRRVQVGLDSLGAVEVKIWDVNIDSYVGRREYERGYLVPVKIRVDFPRKNLMSIKITGSRFVDIVRYQVVGSDLYIVDLYTQPLPQESFFREQTISALWPTEPFEPDIIPMGEPTGPADAIIAYRLWVPQKLARRISPYSSAIRRAVVWAGSISGVLFITGLPLIWLTQRRKAIRARTNAPPVPASSGANQPVGLEGRAQDWLIQRYKSIRDRAKGQVVSPSGGAYQPVRPEDRAQYLMEQDSTLSYDEATLLADLERTNSPAGMDR
ncbi:MAG: hypothetical protein IID14_00555 [Candidatus Marinimicrobia bacterium]|nr:hypothetical protein [Candidatus Neomarinimicrobiota bacterium]